MSDNERVAVIETKVNALHSRFDKHLDTEEAYMKIQRKLIQEIRNEQAKMKGFWGGVVFVFSAMAVAVGAAMNHFIGKS